jgi:hypothetical protein
MNAIPGTTKASGTFEDLDGSLVTVTFGPDGAELAIAAPTCYQCFQPLTRHSDDCATGMASDHGPSMGGDGDGLGPAPCVPGGWR